jgi:hypothetical protein
LGSRFDPAVFFRVSWSHIVNLRFTEEMAPSVDESYTVRLRGGQLVPVSRRQWRRLRDTLSLYRARERFSGEQRALDFESSTCISLCMYVVCP